MAFVIFSGNVAPRRLVPLLTVVQQETGCSYASIYRGSEATGLLHQLGKLSQAELYDGWVQRRPGFNPANPPGRSTHELRNDGVAYRGRAGRKLRWYQCGIDVDDEHVDDFIKACNRHRWHAHITYPNTPSEHHHVNLTRRPRFGPAVWWRVRPVQLHSRGPRARSVIRLLRGTMSPVTHERYLKPQGTPGRVITPHHVEAIKHFQRDHHQKADGVVGLQTYRALRAAHRRQEAKR